MESLWKYAVFFNCFARHSIPDLWVSYCKSEHYCHIKLDKYICNYTKKKKSHHTTDKEQQTYSNKPHKPSLSALATD